MTCDTLYRWQRIEEIVFEKTDFPRSFYSVSNSVSNVDISGTALNEVKREGFFFYHKRGHLKPSVSVNHWNLSEEREVISRGVIKFHSYESLPLFNI